MTGTLGSPFAHRLPRSLAASALATAVWRLLLNHDDTPRGHDAPTRGVLISGEVRCHVGSSTMSRSPAPLAGYPATLAAYDAAYLRDGESIGREIGQAVRALFEQRAEAVVR